MIWRGARQRRSSWINVNDDVTTAARLNSARFQATIYSASCVSYSPPTCSSTASCRYLLRVLFGDFSFPFFPSFLPFLLLPSLSFPFYLIIKRRASQSDRIGVAEWEYIGKSVYLSDQGPLSSREPSFGGWYGPLVRIWNFPCQRSPVFFEFTIYFFFPPRIVFFVRVHFTTKIFTIFLID